VRKATLASILRKSHPGLRLNEHLKHPEGSVVFQHACKMGLEGIVSQAKTEKETAKIQVKEIKCSTILLTPRSRGLAASRSYQLRLYA
jgi:bifunctional non-homologous end joining protein LigD